MPPSLVAEIVRVWSPTSRPVAVQGLVQASAADPSRLQVTIAEGSLTVEGDAGIGGIGPRAPVR